MTQPSAKPKPALWRKVLLGVVAAFIGLVAIAVIVDPAKDKDKANSAATSSPSSASSVPSSTPAERPAPTNEQVKDAFQTYINERSGSGVMLAKAVTSVTVNDGVVTVTMDASPSLLELSPFHNLAELFGTPVAFNDDDGIWLRRTVQRVDVVDAQGKSLGSMTAAELNKKGAGSSDSGASSTTETPAPKPSGPAGLVESATWTDGAWPFAVDSATLNCSKGADGERVTVTANREMYALNGTAKAANLWPDFDVIWRDDPATPGLKVGIGPMIKRGLELCEG